MLKKKKIFFFPQEHRVGVHIPISVIDCLFGIHVLFATKHKSGLGFLNSSPANRLHITEIFLYTFHFLIEFWNKLQKPEKHSF